MLPVLFAVGMLTSMVSEPEPKPSLWQRIKPHIPAAIGATLIVGGIGWLVYMAVISQ